MKFNTSPLKIGLKSSKIAKKGKNIGSYTLKSFRFFTPDCKQSKIQGRLSLPVSCPPNRRSNLPGLKLLVFVHPKLNSLLKTSLVSCRVVLSCQCTLFLIVLTILIMFFNQVLCSKTNLVITLLIKVGDIWGLLPTDPHL